MSLLDDVSIVVTPNGYKAGTLYAVKPTFVLGSELVTNSIFNSDNTSDWGNGFYDSFTFDSSEGGFYNLQRVTADARTNINLSSVLTVGKRYKVTVVARGSGNIKTGLTTSGYTTQPSAVFTLTSSFASYSTIVTVTSGLVYGVLWNDDGNSNIDYQSYSVKEYTSADMDVTRATAATRVDENGLVNYAEVLGSEIADITSGTPVDASNWANVTSNSVDFTGLGASGVSYYNNVATGLVSGETYIISLTISNFSGSSDLGVSGQGGVPTSLRFINDGTATKVFTSDGSNIRIFGRAGTNTATFSNFSIKKVHKNNVPRIDYTGGGCPHILAEPQRTNLIPYSEAFNSWHTIEYVTVAEDTSETTSPSGNNTASKITINSSSTVRRLFEVISTSSGSDYTFTLYAKKGTTDYIRILLTSLIIDVEINLTNGTVTGGTGSIESVGNDWYKIQGTGTSSLTTEVAQIQLSNSASVNDYLYIWGAQLEQGSYATSYIPTSGSAVTRNQDVFTRDGISSLINSTEGVLFTEIAFPTTTPSTNLRIALSDGTSSNRIIIQNISNQANKIQAYVIVAGGTSTDFSATANDITLLNKIAIKWKANDFALWMNGVEVNTDTSGVSFSTETLNRLALDGGDGLRPFYGKVKQLQVYDTALTDMQLIQLTGTSGTDFYESYSEMAESLTYTIQ